MDLRFGACTKGDNLSYEVCCSKENQDLRIIKKKLFHQDRMKNLIL